MKALARLAGAIAALHGVTSVGRSAERPAVVVAEIGPEQLRPVADAGRSSGTAPAGPDPGEDRSEPRRAVRIVYPSPYDSRNAVPELRTRSLQ